MATVVDHRNARIPPPTVELINRMAAVGHAQGRNVDLTLSDVSEWPKVPSYTKDQWRLVAKQMYGVVATEGGATVRVAKAPQE
jgi:hypothetical protein